MNDLHRELAPISSDAWSAIDAEAKRVLQVNLAARRIVDLRGPLGPKTAAVNLGRVEKLAEKPADGVHAVLRAVQPLVELRVPFEVSRAEIDSIGRGAADPDLKPVIEAATRMACTEDRIVFYGYPAAGIRGICPASPHKRLPISQEYEKYAGTVAEATRVLRAAGVEGPYTIALGPRCWEGLMQATARGGYPIIEMVHRVLDGRAIWAPAVDGAVVMSTKPGHFELTVGQDLSIGYTSHTDTVIRLYLVESLTFRSIIPEGALVLAYDAKA
ncbi:MAG: family 1 encapsulin nanocompartment shell protein [Candidatus Binatia bacterium]